MRTPTEILSYRFRYDGAMRHVDNVTFEDDYQTVIGVEVRKGGKFSWRIKRFAMEKIEGPLERVDVMQSQKQIDRYVKKYG